MEKLSRLIKSLKSSEIQLIEDFYKAKYNGNAAENKRLQLFKSIATGKVHNNEEATDLLYNQKKNSALSHLKKRVEEDILNFLLFDFSYCGLSEATREELHCNKMLLQGKMLLAKGIWEEGISLLEKTSQLSEKYEFTDIKLASDDILRTYNNKKCQQYNQHIEKSMGDYRKMLKAKGISLMFAREFGISQNEKSIENITSNQEKYAKTDRPKKVIFWNKMALLQYYKNEHDFENAKKYALELLENLHADPKVFSDFTFAQANLELAKILIYLKDYNNALLRSENAIQLFPNTSIEYVQGLQVYYFANFRSGKIKIAESAVEIALNHPLVKDVLKSKWILLNAALMFVQKRFSVVNRMIYTQNTEKNDAYWEIGSKILEMLNILETEDFDWFEYKVESLRKRMKSLRNKSNDRIKIFYCLLKTLVRTNYDYNATVTTEKQNLDLLLSNKLTLTWDPMGYELINIRDWFLNKAGLN